MSRKKEQQDFLIYIRDIYLTNPSLEVSEDTIYNEFMLFYENNGKRQRIDKNGLLLNVQQELAKKFGPTFSRSGYFWFFENRSNLDDRAFYDEMYNSIKLYVAVDAENLCNIATQIINYMQKENIVTQSSVAKRMRNDVLVLRVFKFDDAIKVANYINSLNYNSNVKPNPFVFSNGKVSMTMDGSLSYNFTLCKLIRGYIRDSRNQRILEKVNTDDFLAYINQIKLLVRGQNKLEILREYGINSSSEYDYFLMIMDIISKNLDGTMTLDYLNSLSKKMTHTDELDVVQNGDKDKVKYILSSMSKYYSTDDIHEIITKYIETGNLSYFTRKDNIRAVASSFTPSKLNSLINEMCNSALIEAVITTEEKYPNMFQPEYAIKLFILEGSLDGFTNNNNSRSYLGLVVSKERLIEVLKRKISSEEQRQLEKIILMPKEEKEIMATVIKKSDKIKNIPQEYLIKASELNAVLDNLVATITSNIYYDSYNKKVGKKY